MAAEVARRSPESSLSSHMSVEQERDSYKEKVEHMKILLKQCQSELQSYKIRHGGVETYSRLLQETKQENVNLTKKYKALETIVRNLQSRLVSHGLSASLNLEESDMFIPGTSKQVLENLSRENSRLKQLLKSSPNDPEEVQNLQQMIKELSQQNTALQQQLIAKSSKLSELERVISASSDEKDTQIQRLSDKVQELQENFRTREVLCTSLAEETCNLRQQLHDVGTQCQQMALRLENNKDRTKQEAQAKGTDRLSMEIDKLQEENFALKAKLDDVTKMNHRWQAYNTTQEQRIQQLVQELENAQAFTVTPERTESINKALEDAKIKLQTLESDKKLLTKELGDAMNYNSQLTHELEKLRAEIDTRRDDTQLSSNSEAIEALKHQIQICTEDFEFERSDREKAQQRISQLEEELKQIRMEKERYKNQISQLEVELQQTRRERDALNRSRIQHTNVDHNFLTNQGLYNDFTVNHVNQGCSLESQLAARGPGQGNKVQTSVTYQRQDTTEEDSNLQVDANLGDVPSKESSPKDKGGLERGNSNSDRGNSGLDRSNSDSEFGLSLTVPSLNDLEEINENESEVEEQILTCPTCGQAFGSDAHAQLIEHLEICCD